MGWNPPAGRSPGTITTGTNATGTPTHSGAVAATLVDIPNTSVVVPPNTGDVWLCYLGALTQTAIGTGFGYIALVETTAGSTLLHSSNIALPGNGNTQVVPYVEYELGQTSLSRTFKLQTLFTASSGAPQHDIVNSAQEPTFLRAEAR